MTKNPESDLQIDSNIDMLEVYGARVHNLKNIDVQIPRDKLTVITGLSGSGKSSLAFDTIYAEGQRRYIESFSAYARQFLGGMERPDVDKIAGLSPVISIEQKTVNKSPRSTVGTITEIYDFLRLLFARASEAYSYVTGEKMVKYTEAQIIDLIFEAYQDKKIYILSPLVRARKGHYRELFEAIAKKGYLRVRVDGNITEISRGMQLDRYKVHDIELVVDRIALNLQEKSRLSDSVKTALKQGEGMLMIIEEETNETRFFSKKLMCPSSGISYSEPEPNVFSFNSPYGACTRCNGLGDVSEIDMDKIIPDSSLSIKKGGIAPIGEVKDTYIFKQIELIGEKYNFKLTTSIRDIPKEGLDAILYGSNDDFSVRNEYLGVNQNFKIRFEGILNWMENTISDNPSASFTRWAQSFMNKSICPECNGSRLKKEALFSKVDSKNIYELASMDLSDLRIWFQDIEKRLNPTQLEIAREVVKEIRTRIDFLLDVGLEYLTLNRSAKSLSGGEAQRIRLATQIGSKLVGVLYILDEPSIGLHQRDNHRLIQALKELRDIGNTVLVVEHDKDMIEAADYVIDMGPKAGVHGGSVVASGMPQDILNSTGLTAAYLRGELEIPHPKERRKSNGKTLQLTGAKGHNLKSVSVEFPLGTFICVTGVSGSGKSSLINETLYPILSQHFYGSAKNPLPFNEIIGLEHLDKVIDIDQAPIGRTPRSNPATYTGVFSDIRLLFSTLPEAKIRGYKPGRFSFNVKGGRCETCQGAGLKTIEMNFLPDVYVPCEACNGKRYNRETLEVRYKGKSISDVLNMTIEDAVPFFENIPSIIQKIKTLNEVGLGYITLGQASTTLSGGEAQRVKLATELSKKNTGNTFYILDEPTTGLHFEDIRILMEVLQRLVDLGNTVLVIEHNMDVIKAADYIIDLGLEGGQRGGEILFTGSPEEMVNKSDSHTSKYLKEYVLY